MPTAPNKARACISATATSAVTCTPRTRSIGITCTCAEKHGAEVRALHLVTGIEPLAAGGYRVSFDNLEGGARTPGSETASLVILAAGSLGSTEMLLRCRDELNTLPLVSERLGVGWSSNGDFLTPAFHGTRAIHPTQGPTIASIIDFLDGSQNGRVFWVQDGGLPNIAANFIREEADDPGVGFKIKTALEAIQLFLRENEPFVNIMPWFAQGVDAANGKLRLTPPKNGKRDLTLDWNVAESRQVIDTIVAMHQRLAKATDGVALVPLTWSLFQDLITPHPLGGCNMGTTATTASSIIAAKCLVIRDCTSRTARLFPRRLGVNPSRNDCRTGRAYCVHHHHGTLRRQWVDGPSIACHEKGRRDRRAKTQNPRRRTLEM